MHRWYLIYFSANIRKHVEKRKGQKQIFTRSFSVAKESNFHLILFTTTACVYIRFV